MIEVTTDPARAAALRHSLVDELVTAGSIVSGEIEAAFRTVPRHLFAPEVPLDEAYANDVVRTKRDEHGMTISSVSAPWLQAAMLEQAGLRPGLRCLEIGSGGYNAALMAELVGPAGAVTTVDIDPDVADRARRCLADAGYDQVHVVLADAEGGVAEFAPYDRIIAAVGVADVPPAWVDQLAEGGRLVVPLRMRGLRRSVAFVREGAHLVSLGHEMAGFVDIQGAGAQRERLVTLHGDDVGLRIDDSEPVDADGLRGALLQPRVQAWSGVRFGGMEPFDGLFLWLATGLSDFCLVTRARTDVARTLVDPCSPIGTPTLLGGRSFAYLAFREIDTDARIYEFGVYAHGPDAETLAQAMNDQVRTWNREHRDGPAAVISLHRSDTPVDQLPRGRVIERRHTKIVIFWP
ncbi:MULTISPECIES: methyltransferase, FxLD system [unclassified Frankia]|uniref:methyltransferase, FxLD system n=1 Tax=unclassified Frankia TaxID=2632575 RepID=UPI002AD5A859|nr:MULTISPECIES: methyltransferase, FxLD system [unclassified Frankia]